ncbi:MAG: hypothetical protein HEQ20_26545 [Aphanizomenon flos-aquae KM1D3_PB]|uniref:hypothetical protein n=1 Tax=Aphanizomenon flos-aquae TaxID=1176 RepID=UPI001363FE56|nr:hypothetical protein [Aphanizomenon flos-aquae]QSV73684.1 MAG: hypothetical protein HEQ20_26545 [Aphanizomenon flos-aquae KM1D3_PB]
MSLWQGKRQEARVKKFSAILRFFTQFGFIVSTYISDQEKCNCFETPLAKNLHFFMIKICKILIGKWF